MVRYRGRFAPSPTGPLHLGSLYSALAGFLQARSSKGQWFVRIDDLDPFRTIPGAADSILRTLECFGLHWDGPTLYQSQRSEAYRHALDLLNEKGLVYPCICTRKALRREAETNARRASAYPGHCRDKKIGRQQPHALRIKTTTRPVCVHDQLQGRIEQNLAEGTGDFIVRRRDRAYAYQLAVVIDDHEQNITEVLRGSDLLDSTPRQVYLQQLLNLPTPDYLHVPVLVDRRGDKLSKQTHAPPVDETDPAETLFYLLHRLNQSPPPELIGAAPSELLEWAITHWDASRLPRLRSIPIESGEAIHERHGMI
jgi:glutamyl-Q tRNA(Asp) synthetase